MTPATWNSQDNRPDGLSPIPDACSKHKKTCGNGGVLMGKLTLVLGGARSGKSSYAEKLALQNGGNVAFIATAQALDEEMAERIEHHRHHRPVGWKTLELPLGIGKALQAEQIKTDVIVVDCLTLLISNLVMQVSSPEGVPDDKAAAQIVEQETGELLEAIEKSQAEWIVVSNEVGMGLVPAYPLGRVYRDLLGWANQRLASHADRVIFMISGIPMILRTEEI
jgi:adenosylcobinamide kinase / adenosylcobinamide-phosphate guanylyltransferase